MDFKKTLFLITVLFFISIFLLPFQNANAGINLPYTLPESDTSYTAGGIAPHGSGSLFYVFDLRDRETFIQITFSDPTNSAQAFPGVSYKAHIQIFDVSNNCNENNFFDDFTLKDTHVYNMRDIQTNDGNPSGVVLPEGSYGIVAVTSFIVTNGTPLLDSGTPVGNQRILDNNGYEYRTNAQTVFSFTAQYQVIGDMPNYYFNFNQREGVSLSDVIGITVNPVFSVITDPLGYEWNATNVVAAYNLFDIDIYDQNEVPFSCRDIIFSCINEENPRVEELLEFVGTANVASFEYGINNAIPHSKNGELLCPGNVVQEGMVVLRQEAQPVIDINSNDALPYFFGYIGLNNGNGRGSFDSFWIVNTFLVFSERG